VWSGCRISREITKQMPDLYIRKMERTMRYLIWVFHGLILHLTFPSLFRRYSVLAIVAGNATTFEIFVSTAVSQRVSFCIIAGRPVNKGSGMLQMSSANEGMKDGYCALFPDFELRLCPAFSLKISPPIMTGLYRRFAGDTRLVT